jgi:hypothetical protein
VILSVFSLGCVAAAATAYLLCRPCACASEVDMSRDFRDRQDRFNSSRHFRRHELQLAEMRRLKAQHPRFPQLHYVGTESVLDTPPAGVTDRVTASAADDAL